MLPGSAICPLKVQLSPDLELLPEIVGSQSSLAEAGSCFLQPFLPLDMPSRAECHYIVKYPRSRPMARDRLRCSQGLTKISDCVGSLIPLRSFVSFVVQALPDQRTSAEICGDRRDLVFCLSCSPDHQITAITRIQSPLSLSLRAPLCPLWFRLFLISAHLRKSAANRFAIAPSAQSPLPDNPANCAPSTESNRTLSDRESAVENCGS